MVYSLKKYFSDDLVVAVTSGIIATLIKNCFSLFLWFFKLKRYLYWHLAASLFLENLKVPALPLLLIGFLVDIAVASLLGGIFFYLLRLTGKQYAYLKSIIAGLFIWVGVTGLSTRLGISGIDFSDLSTIFSFLITDIVFAVLLTFFILYFGKELLPDLQHPGL